MTAKFERVLGGELPLQREDKTYWASECTDATVVDGLIRKLGLIPEQCTWLSFGRSAIGCALDVLNISGEHHIAAPAYQCPVVFEKLISRGSKLESYPLTEFLAPDEEAYLALAAQSDLMLSTSFFGSKKIDQEMGHLTQKIRSLKHSPWMLEDRAMASLGTLGQAVESNRSDFIFTTFRKSYPVPDGALLVAVSERAIDAMKSYGLHSPQSSSSVQNKKMNVAIQEKLLAKSERYEWLRAASIVDDEDNGLSLCKKSEALIDELAGSQSVDQMSGSTGSARWILARDLEEDHERMVERTRQALDVLSSECPDTFPLKDVDGIGLPMLLKQRDEFRAAAAQRGIFLPVYWPSGAGLMKDVITKCDVTRSWYEKQITLPILPCHSDDEFDYALENLLPLIRLYN